MNKKRFDAIVFTVGINALVLNFRKKEASSLGAASFFTNNKML